MNRPTPVEEIANDYLQRIIEKNKPQYVEAYNAGKKAMYRTLAEKDALIYRQQEILLKHKLSGSIKIEAVNAIKDIKYNQKWTWVSKIIYLLMEKNAPLRSQQMIEYFVTIDTRMKIAHDRQGYFSAYLTKAVKNNRVVKIKVKGFKGYFYALPEWLENGELPPTYFRKMNLFVSQESYCSNL